MTMLIVVKNGDHARTAKVREEEYEIGRAEPTRVLHTNIAPLSEQSFYIHASRRLIVEEDPDATVPKE